MVSKTISIIADDKIKDEITKTMPSGIAQSEGKNCVKTSYFKKKIRKSKSSFM